MEAMLRAAPVAMGAVKIAHSERFGAHPTAQFVALADGEGHGGGAHQRVRRRTAE
jgi:hypothetical protein